VALPSTEMIGLACLKVSWEIAVFTRKTKAINRPGKYFNMAVFYELWKDKKTAPKSGSFLISDRKCTNLYFGNYPALRVCVYHLVSLVSKCNNQYSFSEVERINGCIFVLSEANRPYPDPISENPTSDPKHVTNAVTPARLPTLRKLIQFSLKNLRLALGVFSFYSRCAISNYQKD
jgi:hypothetical protein